MARSQTDPSQILPGNPSQVLQTNVAGDTVEWVDPLITEEQDNKVRVVDVFVSIFNDLETNKIPEILNSFNALSETIRTVAENEIVLIKADIEFQENEPFTELYILKTGKGIQNNIVATDIELINKSREISFINVNGTTTKTITLGFVDGTSLTANWTDEVGGGSSVVVDNTLNGSSANPVENQVIEDTFQRVSLAATSEPIYRQPFFGATYKRTADLPGNSLSGVTADAEIIMTTSATVNTNDWYMLVEDSFLASEELLSSYFSKEGNLVHFFMGDIAKVPSTDIDHIQRFLSIIINTTPSTDLVDVPAGYTVYKEENIINSIVAGSTAPTAKSFNVSLAKENLETPSISFTPTIIDQGGGATYSFSGGLSSYKRISSSLYYVNIVMFNINTSGTPSGKVAVSNLPITGTFAISPLSGFLRQDQNVSGNVLSRTPVTFGSDIVFGGLGADTEDVDSITLTNGLLRVAGLISTT